jgi:hypothetical protein
MDTWERIAKWMKDNYTDEQFKKSEQIAGDKLIVADAAWRQLCLLPIYFLKTPNGQIDKDIHNSIDAFLIISLGCRPNSWFIVRQCLIRSIQRWIYPIKIISRANSQWGILSMSSSNST